MQAIAPLSNRQVEPSGEPTDSLVNPFSVFSLQVISFSGKPLFYQVWANVQFLIQRPFTPAPRGPPVFSRQELFLALP